MLTIAQAAEMYAVTQRTVRQWIHDGLPAFHRGQVVRIAESDLEEWRRLHTWHGAAGARGHFAGGSSSAATGNMSTGAPSFREALSDAVANSKAARKPQRDRGSSRTSDDSNVVYLSKETA